MTFIQIAYLIGRSGDMKGKFLKNLKKNLHLRNHKEDEAETWHTCLGHWPLHNLCFYSGRIRTLVGMATYIFHRHIMGKVKIDIFSVSVGVFGIYFYMNFY